MKTSDFFYHLPEELIAQTPLKDRSSSRLLYVQKDLLTNSFLPNIEDEVTLADHPETMANSDLVANAPSQNKKDAKLGIFHEKFSDVLKHLRSGDCLVLNETKVIPARLHGKKETGAICEVLLLKRHSITDWEALVHPGRKLKIGAKIVFSDRLSCKVISILEEGARLLRFDFDGIFEDIIDKLGEMPIPPYITEKLDEKSRYNTVYAKNDGSAAAPTAGLHFTDELLTQAMELGVKIARLTLHVGLGTFRPVKVEDVEAHKMHSENYFLDEENAEIINDAKKDGGRIISVGTTSTRVLETLADDGKISAGSGETSIFIYPGYKFKLVDGLITNFHLPESTLIMLVSAIIGKDRTLDIYKRAVDEKYRFFSFGDAMLII